MEIIALSILIFFSLVGFAAIFFTTFGTLIILLGAVLYALMTGFSLVGIEALILIVALYLLGEVLEYVFIVLGAKKFGASNAAVAGAIVGGIIGAVMGAAFFGVGLIFGAFIGIFLGAFTVELLIHKDLVKSLKAGAGGVLGRIGSVVVKVMIALVMFAILALNILNP